MEGDLDSRLTLLLLPKQDVFLRSGKDAAAVSRVQEELWPEVFRTRQLASPLFCHETFLEKLSGYRTQPIGKRVGLLLQRLAVDESRLHFKATQGVNRGWRRSRLGGNFGSHFYAWWAPRNAAPLKAGDGFEAAPEGAIVLRDIRHHDDHSALAAQSFQENYLPVSVEELRREEFSPAPWTQAQFRFASARHAVRLLKGHPGSGKTTALLHAADTSGAARVLYLTYSSDLAKLARLYFDRYCSDRKQFHVLTFQTFLRQLINSSQPAPDEAALRKRFQGDLSPYARSLGPWTDHVPALYEELHAHLAGSALPVAAGRFAAAKTPRCPDANYRERRIRYLGQQGASLALDAAARLERAPGTLAERYFPDLHLAWTAATALQTPNLDGINPSYLAFDCIAVDETQDLTALEAFVVAELARRIGQHHKRPIPLLLAGDEAQTVRPTDFEWAWMSDLLHHRLATPSEFRLQVNLRSPRRLAHLVNRVWDLYTEIDKIDRPSGAGYAEIEDDATDQLLYCTAAPGDDLNELLAALAAREGLAMIALDAKLPAAIPESLAAGILTVSEAKGLDFHSVCVIDAGRHLAQISELEKRHRAVSVEIERLRKRLAIDQFRVALSRPTERLIWLDILPSSEVVEKSLRFLNGTTSDVAPSVPSAILQTLAEEELDLEERIQRCLTDARQFLEVKPDLAWSRAAMAVTLLGEPHTPGAVVDEDLRRQVHRAQCEICFTLATRGARLSPELGRIDLFIEAHRAASAAGDQQLVPLIATFATASRSDASVRLTAFSEFADHLIRRGDKVPAWFMTEITPSARQWTDELERAIAWGNNAEILAPILPNLYDALRLPDAQARKSRIHERAVQLLLKNQKYASALRLLESLPERNYKQEAQCLEKEKRYAEAAARFRLAGDTASALDCFRRVPDFQQAFALLQEMPQHPARDAYQWLVRMQALLAERPEKFNRLMLPEEKKLLETMLEQALGVARKKPAARKTAAPAKGAARKKAAAPKKSPAKRAPRASEPF
ncbi:MAG: hypothetical protein ACKV22_02335 [Bryobacteraceae bacterium]